jgi:histidine triad (HIT) family protein
MFKEDCIFCKISKLEVPSNKVYEDEDVFAFRDINPQAPVHIIIIPKRHIMSFAEVKDDDFEILGKVQIAASKIAKRLTEMKNGFRIVNNCGPDGGQTVAHIHYHLLGGRVFSWPPG